MNTKFWSSEKMLSLTAVLVSVVTLVVFLYQTNLIRKQQYMSVYPFLELSHKGIETDDYAFVLKNKGIGPALITKVVIVEKGKPAVHDFVDYIAQRKLERDSFSFLYANIFEGRLISAGEQLELIANHNNDFAGALRLLELLTDENLTWEIEYESIYGERWRLKNNQPRPEKIK